MFRYSKLSRSKVLAMLITMTVIGMAIMIIISIKSTKTETRDAVLYISPKAGMSSVMEGYISANGKSSVDMLSTTAVAVNGGNKYYHDDGTNVGKLIVCTADDFAPVYLIKDETSGMYGKVYKDSVATLISSEEDDAWCKIVSGNLSGYVKAEDFAFGQAAEALDNKTYITVATVASDELTLREEEDMTSVAKCILSPDTEYEVVKTDEGTGWTKLNVTGVGEGYVLSEYITVSSKQKVGVTLDQEYAVENSIGTGVAEAQAREAMWTANRIAAEAAAEAERLATEEAIAAYEAAAAEAARIQAEYEALYTVSYEEPVADTSSASSEDYVSYETDIEDEDWSDFVTEDSYTDDSSEDYGYDDSGYVEEYNDTEYYEEDYSEDDWSDDSSEDYYEETYTEESYEEEVYVDTAADIRQQLVSYARSFCGWLPYVSGGQSLSSGADCSGFTSAIYGAFGYGITPSSVGQQYVGRSVSVSEALPGDIIIYNYGQHVAIYSGGGMKIHSPYPGEVVNESSMYSMNITDIRRIIE